MSIRLCGILNLTPDSFSDGGKYQTREDAYNAALKILEEGAEIIDIGGDSTRPGSVCITLEEEWRRIKDIINPLSKITTVSVDTHRAEIARRAIDNGAKVINDISAGSDPEMFKIIGDSSAKIVLMFSTCSAPHIFTDSSYLGINQILEFFRAKIKIVNSAGVSNEKIVIDPGMGRFISKDPKDSLDILENLTLFMNFNLPIMLGISRKGFVPERSDENSAKLALEAIKKLNRGADIILRVHNVAMHAKLIETSLLFSSS